MNRTQWSTLEVTYLTESYFAGKRIKTIANELNRSSMSVSKALARFNIRPDSKTSSTTLMLVPTKPSKPRIREKQKRFHDDWISSQRMIRWMVDNKFNIREVDTHRKKFSLNHISVTMGQLLLNCNRYRLEKNLPIFRVKGITNV